MARRMSVKQKMACGLVALVILAVLDSTALAQAFVWTNPATGVSAGNWSVPTNWNLGIAPGNLSTTRISNGGESLITSNVSVGRIEVGKNGGIGFLTSTTPGIAISTRTDFDIGETGGAVAAGPITVTSNGITNITDAASLVVGTTGTGELDVGQANATLGATANSIGVFTVERIAQVQIAENVEVGQASGSATANGNGTLTANNITTFDVGRAFNVGLAASSTGVRNATGIFNSNFVNLLMVNDDFSLGQSYSSGSQGVSNVMSSIADAGTVNVGGDFHVGSATAKGGGTAQSTATLNLQRTSLLTVGNDFNVGRVSSQTASSGGAAISGQADTLATSATLTEVGNISVGAGLFVGRAFTGDNAKGNANGTLTIDTATSLTIGTDLDIGQTGSSGIATDFGVSTTGNGSVTIRNVTGAIGIGGDIDVGTTGSAANTTTLGSGTLLVDTVGTLNIAVDLDIGQVSGAGQSTSIGMATLRSISSVIIGDDIDLGFASGSANSTNSGTGTLIVSDSTVSVGFANPLLPGSFHLGNISAPLGTRAQGMANAVIERSSVSVAESIAIGKLTGGSTDSSNSSQGILRLIDSSIVTPLLDVATVLNATAGTVSGTVDLDSSLVTVTGAMTLGPDSLLEFSLAGTTKSDGLGTPGQYSAIDVGSAFLDGDLDVFLTDGFIPSAGDSFQIISGSLSGTFNPVGLPALSGGLGWNVQYNPSSVVLQVLGSLFTADFDNDTDVDNFDLGIWESSFGGGAGADADSDADSDGVDFLAWQQQFGSGVGALAATQPVPEPATGLLSLFSLAIFAARTFRTKKFTNVYNNGRGTEQ